ncbi:MAG: hypothetical protein ACKOYM_00240, partial [Actinomycetes bacterium]
MAPATFYLRECGRWSEMPLDRDEPLTVALADVLTRAEPSSPTRKPAGHTSDRMVSPEEPILLLADETGVWVVPPGADTRVSLGTDELTLLDQLDRPRLMSDLADTLGRPLDEICELAERLERAGALYLLDPSIPIDSGPTAEPVDEAALLAPRDRSHPALQPLDPERVPVISPYLPENGPPLALGMIISNARVWDDGALNEAYEFRPVVTHDEARIL